MEQFEQEFNDNATYFILGADLLSTRELSEDCYLYPFNYDCDDMCDMDYIKPVDEWMKDITLGMIDNELKGFLYEEMMENTWLLSDNEMSEMYSRYEYNKGNDNEVMLPHELVECVDEYIKNMRG